MPNPKRDRWYSMDGQNRSRYQASEGSRGTRKIISLVILLGLVLILIQQTSDTQKVEQVATAIGLLPDPNGVQQTDNDHPAESSELQSPPRLDSPRSQSPRSQSPSSQSKLDREYAFEKIALQTTNPTIDSYADIWRAVLDLAPPSSLPKIARAAFSNPPSPDATLIGTTPTGTTPAGTTPADLSTVVQSWSEETRAQLDAWLKIETENTVSQNQTTTNNESILFRFATLFQKWSKPWEVPSPDTTASDWEDWQFFQRGFQLALDRTLLEAIEDNSPWRSNERLPFLRSWQRIAVLRDAIASGETGPAQIPKVEVSQLMSVADSLRCIPIRFLGTIARVDQPDSIHEPGFETTEYKIFWLRPDDLSQQPIKVYAPSANVDQELELAEKKPVMICGFFFKRFAYAAQRGPEVAPILMAAYVGPTTASAGNPSTTLMQFHSVHSKQEPSWMPPIDLSKPYGIAKDRLASSMTGLFMDNVDLDSLSRRDDMEVVRPLLAVTTLSPEIRLLARSRQAWPVTARGSIARIIGVVNKVELIALAPEFASLLDRDVAYRCSVNATLPDGSSRKAILLCSAVPNAWLSEAGGATERLLQPCLADGLLLSDETGSPLMMWSKSPQWIAPFDLPVDSIPAPGNLRPEVALSHWFLMQKQWDLSWLDMIQSMQTEPIKPLSQAEHEPLYTLIRLAKQTPYADIPVSSSRTDTQTISGILDKLRTTNKSKEASGKTLESKQRTALDRVAMEGRIVRVTMVPVQEPEQVKMLGADHYYQLDVMADVGNRSYEIKTETDPILYHKEYPVTCVMAELPAWLRESSGDGTEQSSDPSSSRTWYPRRKAILGGWFYRFWKYKTLEMSQAIGDRGRQIGPLVVIDSLQSTLAEKPSTADSLPFGNNTLSILISVLGVGAIWWFVRNRLAAKPKLKFQASPSDPGSP